MGWARVDESGAELGGRGSTHVQRCREWVDGTACGRPGDDGLRRYVVYVLIRTAAAWLQQPMTPPAFAKGRLDALGG